jgi:hypothetical protein
MHGKTKNSEIYELGVRVLISHEDGQFCAHALELDLLGYGKTETKAVAALLKAIDCQISFARYKNDDSLLPFAAPAEFMAKWEEAHTAALKNEMLQDKTKAVAIAIKAAWVTIHKPSASSPKQRFEAMELACA